MSWTIYTDGASKPFNPGAVGIYSFIIKKNGVEVYSQAEIFDVGESVSNNVAEYYAILKASEYIQQEQPNIVSVCFISDSKMLVNQMNGKWAIRFGLYTKTAREAIPILEELRNKYKIIFKWVNRNQNKEADHLCNIMYGRYIKEKNIFKLGLEAKNNKVKKRRRRKR